MGKILLIPAGGADGPGLGLLYLARAAINGGYKKGDIIYFYRELGDSIKEINGKQDYDIIGVSTTLQTIEQDAELALAVKQSNPSALLVVGGHFSTYYAKSAQLMSAADIVVRGEGERFFRDLCRKVRKYGICAPLTEADVRKIIFKEASLERFQDRDPRKVYAELALSKGSEAKKIRDKLQKGLELRGLDQRLVELQRRNLLKHLDLVGGIFFYEGKALEVGPARPLTARELNSPQWAPCFDIIDWRRFAPKGALLMRMCSARGCSKGCKMCILRNRQYRKIEPQVVVGWLDSLVKGYRRRGITHFFFDFADETFTLDRQHVMQLCKRIIKVKKAEKWPRVEFMCETRIDSVDENLLAAMRAAGFVLIRSGVESPSDRVLAGIDKGYSAETIRENIDKIADAGFGLTCYVILFTRDSLVSDIIQTIRFIIDIQCRGGDVSPIVGITPTAGSRLGKEVRPKTGENCIFYIIKNPRKKSARWNKTFGMFEFPYVMRPEDDATSFLLSVSLVLQRTFVRSEEEGIRKYGDCDHQFDIFALFVMLNKLVGLFGSKKLKDEFVGLKDKYLSYLKKRYPKYPEEFSEWDAVAARLITESLSPDEETQRVLFSAFGGHPKKSTESFFSDRS